MGWKTVMKQQKLVEKMTIEEKAAILSGKTVWQTRELESRQGQETIWD